MVLPRRPCQMPIISRTTLEPSLFSMRNRAGGRTPKGQRQLPYGGSCRTGCFRPLQAETPPRSLLVLPSLVHTSGTSINNSTYMNVWMGAPSANQTAWWRKPPPTCRLVSISSRLFPARPGAAGDRARAGCNSRLNMYVTANETITLMQLASGFFLQERAASP